MMWKTNCPEHLKRQLVKLNDNYDNLVNINGTASTISSKMYVSPSFKKHGSTNLFENK